MTGFCFPLYLRDGSHNIFWEVRDAVALRAMWFAGVGPAHAFFSHIFHLV